MRETKEDKWRGQQRGGTDDEGGVYRRGRGRGGAPMTTRAECTDDEDEGGMHRWRRGRGGAPMTTRAGCSYEDEDEGRMRRGRGQDAPTKTTMRWRADDDKGRA